MRDLVVNEIRKNAINAFHVLSGGESGENWSNHEHVCACSHLAYVHLHKVVQQDRRACSDVGLNPRSAGTIQQTTFQMLDLVSGSVFWMNK
jgi:hypothetical protein